MSKIYLIFIILLFGCSQNISDSKNKESSIETSLEICNRLPDSQSINCLQDAAFSHTLAAKDIDVGSSIYDMSNIPLSYLILIALNLKDESICSICKNDVETEICKTFFPKDCKRDNYENKSFGCQVMNSQITSVKDCNNFSKGYKSLGTYEYCLLYVMTFNMDDCNYGESSNRFITDKCDWFRFIRTGDIAICDNMKRDDHRQQCYIMGINVMDDKKKCDVMDGSARDECNAQLAYRVEHSFICEYIETSEIKSNCFHNLAVKIRDIELCEKLALIYTEPEISSEERAARARDMCIWEIAQKTNNRELCDLIPDGTYKSECIQKTL